MIYYKSDYGEVTVMQFVATEKAIGNALASVEMEGFVISAECIDWCKMLLNKEITMAQYIELVKASEGV